MDAPLSEHIAPLYVDVEHNVVWQGETRLRLTPKACAVLQYLMARQDGRVPGGFPGENVKFCTVDSPLCSQ